MWSNCNREPPLHDERRRVGRNNALFADESAPTSSFNRTDWWCANCKNITFFYALL